MKHFLCCVTILFTAFPRAYAADYDCYNRIDLFLIIGQSNAEGRGNKATSPIVPKSQVLRFYLNAPSIVDANDPIYTQHTQAIDYNAITGTVHYIAFNGGSAWPAFGSRYFAVTSRKIGFVLAPLGGTSQVMAADIGAGNWDDDGSLFKTSVRTLNEGIEAYKAAGYIPIVKGILVVNGETDAMGVTKRLITGNDYVAAFNRMAAKYRTIYGVELPIYIFRTGEAPDMPGEEAGFAAIRAAQEQIVLSDAYTIMIWRDGVNASRNHLYGIGSHYNQAGYNTMGKAGADNLIMHSLFMRWQPYLPEFPSQ